MMTFFTFEPGSVVPEHDHPHEQITYIAQGPVNFFLGEGDEQTVDRVETGDMIVIPPNTPHTVEVLGETARLVDCFYPIREGFLSK